MVGAWVKFQFETMWSRNLICRGTFPNNLQGILTITLDIYSFHAFLITDINEVINTYACGECQARFTKACNLSRHAKMCTKGETKIDCSGEQVHAPNSLFERAFDPYGKFVIKAICWIEYKVKQRGSHIHHQRCGHGSERAVACAWVDGYHPESKTVFQFHGFHWHGWPEERSEVLRAEKKNGKRNITQSAAYEQTLKGNRTILEAGYNLVVKWSYEKPKPWWNESIPQKRNETFPHSIVFDFEAFQDVSKRTEPTPDLIFESEHEPVSVSLADTLNREPEHICSKEPQELVRKLREILKMRGAIRREEIRIKCFPEVIKCLSKPQQSLIEEW